MTHFEELKQINVSDYTEMKGRFTYLSWPYAVEQLLLKDPFATWSYLEEKHYGDTVMVFCAVSAFGKTMTAQLPVMNEKNEAIEKPNAVEVNKAMQRCLVKAIALHGIGLYLYSGEDLPESDMETLLTEAKTLEELKAAWKKVNASDISKEEKKRLAQIKDELKATFTH